MTVKIKKKIDIKEISQSVWFRVGIQKILPSFFQWANNVQIDSFLFFPLNWDVIEIVLTDFKWFLFKN